MQSGESAPVTLASKDSAHAAIDSFLAQRSGRMVNITAPNGTTLTVGICASGAVLAYQASMDPPYYLSKGPSDDSDRYVTLDFGGEPTDYPLSSVVPDAAAVSAAHAFIATGAKPGTIDWQEV